MFVTFAGNDSVGKRLAFDIRQDIQKAPGYALVDSAKEGFTVQILSLDPYESTPQANQMTTISVVVTMQFSTDGCGATQYLVFHNIYISGSDVVDKQAQTILADIDQAIVSLRQALKQ